MAVVLCPWENLNPIRLLSLLITNMVSYTLSLTIMERYLPSTGTDLNKLFENRVAVKVTNLMTGLRAWRNPAIQNSPRRLISGIMVGGENGTIP